jgi:hypothetical protein
MGIFTINYKDGSAELYPTNNEDEELIEFYNLLLLFRKDIEIIDYFGMEETDVADSVSVDLLLEDISIELEMRQEARDHDLMRAVTYQTEHPNLTIDEAMVIVNYDKQSQLFDGDLPF